MMKIQPRWQSNGGHVAMLAILVEGHFSYCQCLEDHCQCCLDTTEDLLHVLRDCKDSKLLWKSLIDRNGQNNFFCMNLPQWLRTNIFNSSTWKRDGWSGLFITICWLLWKRRNLKIFEQKEETNESLLIRARAILNNIDRVNIMIK